MLFFIVPSFLFLKQPEIADYQLQLQILSFFPRKLIADILSTIFFQLKTETVFFYSSIIFYFLSRPLLQFAKSSWILTSVPKILQSLWWCALWGPSKVHVTWDQVHSILVWKAAYSQNATECPEIEVIVCIIWRWGNSFFAFEQSNLQSVCLAAAAALFPGWPLADL